MCVCVCVEGVGGGGEGGVFVSVYTFETLMSRQAYSLIEYNYVKYDKRLHGCPR